MCLSLTTVINISLKLYMTRLTRANQVLPRKNTLFIEKGNQTFYWHRTSSKYFQNSLESQVVKCLLLISFDIISSVVSSINAMKAPVKFLGY